MCKGKIYISGPVTGTPDYKERFSKVHGKLEAEGWKVFNPVPPLAELPIDCTHGEYMTVALAMLSLCDTMYLMKGWEKSEGCRMEWAYARQHDITIIDAES